MMDEIRFYWSLFLRRLPYLSIIVLVCTIAGVFVAVTLPPVYRAQTRLVVESPQIPGELASSTVQASVVEILEVIQQRIMTQDNLLELSKRFDLHADKPGLSSEEIVEDMRERIRIELPFFSVGNRASFVPISFDASTGEKSALVVDELAEQILRENMAMRTSATGQTLAFFVQEVARLDDELGVQGAKILEFKEAHKDALPDSLDYRRSRQSSLQERVLQLERELSGLRDRRSRLVEIYERTGRPDILGESLTPEQRQLRQLQDQLASALVIYSPENPRIKSLQAQIAALEAANIQLGLGTETAPNITAFELQLSDIDGQIEFIEGERDTILSELDALKISIDATPTNAIALGTLERDYENLRLQYTQATASLADARTGDQIEAQSRGQRISVAEQAIVPTSPAEPKRKLIVAAGLAGGLGLAGGIFLLMELLNSTIRRPSDVASQLGLQVFGAVPYMETPKQAALRRSKVALLFVVMGVIACGSLYLIHLHYMPFNLIADGLVEKLGFGEILGRFEAG